MSLRLLNSLYTAKTETMETEILITLGIILMLLVLSAFFSGAETSLTAASIPRMNTLARQGDHRAELVVQPDLVDPA